MANELTNVDEKNLSAQEQSELDTQIDALIERHKNNRYELNRLALEGATALAAGDKLTQEKASQGFFKRFRKTISGANNRTQDEINKDLVKAQYAAQKTLQSLAEQNLMSFELIAVLNNKFNAAMIEVNDEINEVYRPMVTVFRESRAEIVRIATQLEQVERNVNLLTWQNSIEYQMYNGVEYQDLDDATKLVCLVRDFFAITKGNWCTADLLLLKTAMSTIGLKPNASIPRQNFVRQVGGDKKLYNHLLGEGSRLDEFATEYETLTFELREVKDSVGKKFFLAEQTTDENDETKTYDFALELIYNLRQLTYAKAQHEKFLQAKKLFLNYKIKDALPILTETADAGIATSRYILAVIYNEGFEVEKNPELAKELLTENILAGDTRSIFFGRRLDIVTQQDAAAESGSLVKAADGGDVFAQYELSKYHPDAEEHYLKMAVEQNYFLACHELGCKYYSENLYETARKFFELADKMGYGKSTMNLGTIYYYGNGVTKDEKKAVELYKKAYERGADNDHSINAIARSFSNDGKGDNATALKWWRIGEEKNYPFCLANLGWAYRYGYGVAKNCSTAVKYFERSIAAGLTNGYSEERLGDIYFDGGDGIERDYEKAATYYEAALAKGKNPKNLAKAEYETGKKYFEFIWKKLDYAKAVEWYKKAHEHGYGDDCIYKIAGCYGALKDYAEALKWYLLGEEKGDEICAWYAGDYYRRGKGVEKNYAEAVKHYKRNIELGDNDGQAEYCISMIYLAGGYGIERNVDTTDEWFKKSAAKGNENAKRWVYYEQVRKFVKDFLLYV